MTEVEQTRVFVVDKAKSCSCGGSVSNQCCHIKAVSDHLHCGGERAPEKDIDTSPSSSMVCPICGAAVQGPRSFWRCSEDSSHYWQWRGEQFGVKDFLTKPHPNKLGTFYEQTDEARTLFRAAAYQRYTAALPWASIAA